MSSYLLLLSIYFTIVTRLRFSVKVKKLEYRVLQFSCHKVGDVSNFADLDCVSNSKIYTDSFLKSTT